MTLQDKFHRFRSALSSSLIERDSEIDLVLAGLLAREHPLLVGPPGVAKSLLLDGVANWVDATQFDYLLTKFTDPIELFGPIDFEHLKKGVNRRNISGYMPTSPFVFLDEAFKASSAILNTLLKILNERIFKYGLQKLPCPLILCVAASNEWPNAETMQELGALFDRFLLRKKVRPVSDDGRRSLIRRSMLENGFSLSLKERITPDELEQAHKQAMKLEFGPNTEEVLLTLIEELHRDGIFPGDRRIGKATKLYRAKAWLEGADEILPEHLEVLSHALWVDPQEQPDRCEKIVTKIANPLGAILFDCQQQMFNVESKANEKLKTVSSSLDRKRIIEEVINKGREIESDLKTRKDTPLRTKILSYVVESRKNWDRKLHQLPPK